MNKQVKWLMDYLDSHEVLPEIQKAINLIWEWSCIDHGYESKNARIREWNQNNQGMGDSFDFYEIVTHIFSGCLLNPDGMTYQAMIGYISGNIGCKDPLDRAKCAAEVIALCYQAELIEITKISQKTFMITTEFELPVEIPEYDKHLPLFRKPSEVSHIPILGNQFKKHEGDVCRQHIDKMNSIPLALEFRVIADIPETPKELETDEQKDQWGDFLHRSHLAYAEVAKHDPAEQPFYLEHNHDTRGRCYCSGYYINYQGSSFKKAIVQLANKEVVQLDP